VRLKFGNASLESALGQFRLGLLIVHQQANQSIQTSQLLHRLPTVRLRIEKMLVSVQNHAKLDAPVADVVVADDAAAHEPKHSA
jgi:hypothetical protein